MWNELTQGEEPHGISGDSVIASIKRRTTVSWPNDIQFREAIKVSNLYDRKVCNYALYEYEKSLPIESPSDPFEIEHILPHSPTTHWKRIFGKQYDSLVNTWANLIPITRRMNPACGQDPFDLKRQEYSHSIYASTRKLADDFNNWSPTELHQRADVLVEWALTRWPHH